MKPLKKVEATCLALSVLINASLLIAAVKLMHDITVLVAFTAASTLTVYLALLQAYRCTVTKRFTITSEVKELENFLLLWGEFMSRGENPEASLMRALSKYEGPLKGLMEDLAATIVEAGVPVKQALSSLRYKLSEKQSHRLILLVQRLIEHSTQRAGKRIVDLILSLRENRQLRESLEQVIRAEAFKVKLLCVLSGCLLAVFAYASSILAALSASSTSIMEGGLSAELSTIRFSYYTAFFAFTIYPPTLVALFMGEAKPYAYSLMCALAYIFTALLTSLLR
ncbi:MAG: hypothetical protein QXK12_06360 [Candidatus Nezhaarchaeales archaeon]